MSSLKFCVASRKHLRATVTRIHTDIGNFSLYDDVKKHNVKLKLTNIKTDLTNLDSKISELKFEDDGDEDVLLNDMIICEQYGDKISECVTRLALVPTVQPDVRDTPRSLLKSPVAPLPTFSSAQGENLELFLRNFEETISKYNYTEYDKLLLLKQQISGRALFLIDSLEAGSQTYSEAKALLMSALASKPVQVFNLMKQLSEMKLSYNSEPFQYISDIRKIMQSVKQLNVGIDDVMQYFFFIGLNEAFKNQLILVTNNSRPTLTEIVDKFFEANERYTSTQLQYKINKNKSNIDQPIIKPTLSLLSNTIPTTVSDARTNPFVNCSLCPNGDHPINKCVVYPKPADKLARLEHIKGCIRCANAGHQSSACKFRFKKPCNLCSSWHFTFICPSNRFPGLKGNNPNYEPVNTKLDKKTQSTVVVTNFYQGGYNIDSILSTFVCTDGSSKLRGLRDSGSQSNFICERLLTDSNHVVVRDVSLLINGINQSKAYKSKLVKMQLSFGGEDRSVEFLTLPKINISLSLPGLSTIVREFICKGYNMADCSLIDSGNVIENLDLILGANAAYCFNDCSVHFGERSVFTQTQFGIMLLGNVEQMLSDLVHLPVFSNLSHGGVSNIETSTMAINCLGFPLLSSNSPVYAGKSGDDYMSAVEDRSLVYSNDVSSRSLEEECSLCLNKDSQTFSEGSVEINTELVRYLLSNTLRSSDGRLIMPLLWNGKVKHLLANNFKLARSILNSNLKKLLKNTINLELMDSNIKELEASGIIEKIYNLPQFIEENPTCSFLPHMPIIKLNKESTKCRMVFMSNLCEKSTDESKTISHNQAMYAGPCVNQKLTVAMILLRFDPSLVCFDLKKAFLQIELPETDQNKLLFLWHRNVAKGDFALQAYKNVRLSFGLRCSPTILMVGLYKMLVVDAEHDCVKLRKLKRLIYNLIYMDNGAVTSESSNDLIWAFEQLNDIFNPYLFELQQFYTNDDKLQSHLGSGAESVVDLFGLKWDTKLDFLFVNRKILDQEANSKRQVLKTVAEKYDPYNFEGPLLNRARVFLHKLQSRTDTSWDETLSCGERREWRNICKQINSSPSLSVPRFVGNRSDRFKLIAFTDSSKLIYGTVIYIQNLSNNKVSFLLARNRIVNKQLESKTIPTLEFMGIVLGTETLVDLKTELSGQQCLCPIDISELALYSDSLVCLSWINSYARLDKLNKQTTFIRNRLEKLRQLCQGNPINFSFVDGVQNPADCITRPMSHKQLVQSNYLTGPLFLTSKELLLSRADIMCVTIPSPLEKSVGVSPKDVTICSSVLHSRLNVSGHLVPLDRMSTIQRLIGVHVCVLSFVRNLKRKLMTRDSSKYSHFSVSADIRNCALNLILKNEQIAQFEEVFNYFSKSNPNFKDMPNLVMQLNVFIDNEGLLRVGSKMNKNRNYGSQYFPLLLPKSSLITNMIILESHARLFHSGIYSVLTELRRRYWIPNCFSVVKRALKGCVHCRRFNSRTLKLNQSPYREFRLNPSNIPFSNVFLDYIGPYLVRVDSGKVKVYILIITCLWTRAINLKISLDLSTGEFLRSLQLHTFEFGVPQLVLSDLGSQLVAGADIITNFLSDPGTQSYFSEHNSKVISFQQYYKGCSQLGALVESCVKLTKRLLSGSVGNNVLEFRDFDFIVSQTVHLVNRRPVAFRESLRDCSTVDLPEPITPELLIHGHNLLSINLIPSLQVIDEDDFDQSGDFDPIAGIRNTYSKLCKVRSNLLKLYNTEFLTNLIGQATNSQSKYKPVTHEAVGEGDIVLLKESNTKPTNYPMARVKTLQVNDLGEVTGAVVHKGKTGELVKRHSSVIIPLLRVRGNADLAPSVTDAEAPVPDANSQTRPPSRRQAAVVSAERTRTMLTQ